MSMCKNMKIPTHIYTICFEYPLVSKKDVVILRTENKVGATLYQIQNDSNTFPSRISAELARREIIKILRLKSLS